MTVPNIRNAHDPETRNIINAAIDLINIQGKSIQDLVAEGQLTPSQYAELVSIVNGNVKKGSITTADIDKNNFSVDQTMISDSLRQIITGNAPINAVPANNSLTTEKYVNESVTKAKRTIGGEFATVIFKGEIPNLNLKSGERGVELKSDFRVFDSKQNIDISGNKKVGFAAGDNSLLLINVKTHEMRCINGMYTHLIDDDEVVMMNIQFTSPSQLAVQQVRATFDYTINGETSIKAESIGNRELKKSAVSIANTDFIEVPNYFNKNDVEIGKSVASTTGEISSIANQSLSNKIKITGEVDLYLQYISVIVCYDENDNYLSGWLPSSTSTKYKTNKNTDYIRLSVRNDRVDIAMVYEGTTEKPYESFNIKLLGNDLLTSKDNYVRFIPEDFNADFVAPNYQYQQMTLEEYNIAFQDLVNGNDELTSEVLGKDATGTYDVIKYKWKPPTYKNTQTNLATSRPEIKKPKIVFVSNVHGFEKPAAYSTYYMIKSMCEDWRSNNAIDYLRHNVELEFIAIANPWGFVNDTYKNGRDVNIQVNFPVYWMKQEQTSSVYGGEEPLSEPEANYIADMVSNNSDALFFTDVHASSGNGFYMISPSGRGYNQLMEKTLEISVEKIDRELKKNYPSITTKDFLGYYQLRPGNGTIDTYVGDEGTPSSVLELFYSLEGESQYSEKSMKAGTELLANYLLSTLKSFKELG